MYYLINSILLRDYFYSRGIAHQTRKFFHNLLTCFIHIIKVIQERYILCMYNVFTVTLYSKEPKFFYLLYSKILLTVHITKLCVIIMEKNIIMTSYLHINLFDVLFFVYYFTYVTL